MKTAAKLMSDEVVSHGMDSSNLLTASVGSVNLKNPVMLASGTAGHGTELSSVTDLASVGALVVKSLSTYEWEGNHPPRLHETPNGMINSIGLQGPGLPYWLEHILPKLIDAKITIILSIWGRTIEDYASAADLCSDLPSAIEAVELNISCPNIEDRGKMFSHSPDSTYEVIQATSKINVPRWAKLSPNVTNLVEIAGAAREAGADGVTLINTVPGMSVDRWCGSSMEAIHIAAGKIAIGSGKTATQDQVNSMHRVIRKELVSLVSEPVADKMKIIYGGSVNSENIESFVSQSEIDGALVGGASLKTEFFKRIL